MIVKTKKYQLPTKKYTKMAFSNILRSMWWVFLIPLALACLTFIWPGTYWFIISAVIITVLYMLFWLIQFTGVTQMEQSKIMFERMSYEIDSRQIMMKISPKQGMPIKWDMVKKANREKDGIVLILSKAQLIYLPYKIFNNQNDIRFLESVLKRKDLL